MTFEKGASTQKVGVVNIFSLLKSAIGMPVSFYCGYLRQIINLVVTSTTYAFLLRLQGVEGLSTGFLLRRALQNVLDGP